MPRRISTRLAGLTQSDIRRMSRECERVGGINLGQGICDLATEPLVREGAVEAIDSCKATYSKFEGIDLLRERIADKVRWYNRYEADPASEIVVTVGSTGGFAAATMATLDRGDEVILFEPYYGYHFNTLKVLGVEPVLVPFEAGTWAIDFDALARAFTTRTRGIVICTPSNPCGKVFTRDELTKIATLCRERGAWIFTDEIYEFIVYDGLEHVSVASLPECRDITITVSGFSKTFSITGWRIGYVTANAEISRAIGLLNDLFYVCAPTPLQWGVARGLEVDRSYYRNLAADYQAKRDLLAAALRDIGMTPYVPDGAYYMLADIRSLGAGDDKSAATELLERTGVASVPGSAFYKSAIGTSLLRFCFAKDFDALDEASTRLRGFRTSALAPAERQDF